MLRDDVWSHAPADLPIGCIRKAVQQLEASGRRGFVVSDAIVLAGQIRDAEAHHIRVGSGGASARFRGVGGSPAAMHLSRRLAEAAYQQVLEVRRGVFGKEAAPFKTPKAAAAWIEREAAAPREARAPMGRTFPRLKRLLQALQRRHGGHWSIGHERDVLLYQHPNRVARVIVPSSTSPLQPLVVACRAIASSTGFPRDVVTTWILTPHWPLLAPVSVSTEYVTSVAGTRTEVVLRVHVPSVDHRTLVEAYLTVRPPGRKRMTTDDGRLLEVIATLGPPPVSGPRRAYWQSVARSLGEPDDAWDRWRKRYKRYEDAQKKSRRTVAEPIHG